MHHPLHEEKSLMPPFPPRSHPAGVGIPDFRARLGPSLGLVTDQDKLLAGELVTVSEQSFYLRGIYEERQ